MTRRSHSSDIDIEGDALTVGLGERESKGISRNDFSVAIEYRGSKSRANVRKDEIKISIDLNNVRKDEIKIKRRIKMIVFIKNFGYIGKRLFRGNLEEKIVSIPGAPLSNNFGVP